MLKNDLKNDIEKTLQAHCPEPPKGFSERMDNKVISLMQKKHNRNVNKGRSRFRLPVLALAAMLVLCFVTAATRELITRPDEIRARETTTPLVTALSEGGQEIVPGGSSDEDPVTKALREEIGSWVISPENIVQELKPVNLCFETQGIRVEILSALVKGTELWVVYSAQDLEGDRISSYTRDSEFEYVSVNQTNYTPENETYATLVFSEEEKKITYVRRFGFDQRIESENGMIELEFGKFLLIHDETVDLTGYLRQYGSRAKGVKPPEGAKGSGGFLMDETKVSWKDAKVLDPSSPLDIQVFKDIYLTGIGWTDDQVHAQFRCMDREERTDGSITPGLLSVWIEPEFSEEKNFMGYGSVEWKPEDGSNTKWMDQTVNCTREEAESMKLSADVMEYIDEVDGCWTIQIPYDEIKAGSGTDAGSEYSPEEIIRSCLWLFTAHWSKGNTAYMLNLCADEWKETRQDPEQAVRKLMESGKPRGIAFNSISGENGDPTRTVDVTVQWEGKDGGYTYSRHEITVRWQQITQEYLIDPEGFETGVAAQPVADEELNLVTEEALIRNTMEAHIPEVSYDELIPISGLSTEKQGIRMEAVSGCIKGNKAYVLCTLQDVDGKYDGYELDASAERNEDENVSVSCPRVYANKADHKSAWLYEIEQPDLFRAGKDTLTVKMNFINFSDEKRVDLMQWLRACGTNAEGIEPPELHPAFSKTARPGMKVLDYTKPMNIRLMENVELANIGWIDNQLHVQIHFTAAPVMTGENRGYIGAGANVYNSVADEYPMPVGWDDTGDAFPDWMEFVTEAGPEDLDRMQLTADVFENKGYVEDNWEIQVPVDMILSETDADAAVQEEEAEAAEDLARKQTVNRQIEENWPGITKELKPVNVSCEKQGIRFEVISALVKGNKSWTVFSLQDLEDDRINEALLGYLDLYDARNVPDESVITTYCPLDFNKTEHKITYMVCNEYSDPYLLDYDDFVVGIRDLCVAQRSKHDLLPFARVFGEESNGVEAPENAHSLHEMDEGTGNGKKPKVLDYANPLNMGLDKDVCLMGIGWINDQLHVQTGSRQKNSIQVGSKSYAPAVSSVVASVTAADMVYWVSDINGIQTEYIFNIRREERDEMDVFLYITRILDVVKDTWEVRIPLEEVLAEDEVTTE